MAWHHLLTPGSIIAGQPVLLLTQLGQMPKPHPTSRLQDASITLAFALAGPKIAVYQKRLAQR